MRLYDEIFKNAVGEAAHRCVVIPLGGGYFEGVRSVGEFSQNCLILTFAKTQVEIVGKRLTIAKYCDGDLRLAGEIHSLRVLGVEGR